MPPMGGQPMQPIQPAQPMMQTGAPGMPMVQQIQLAPEEKKDIAGLIKTIAIIVLSLIAVTFIGLFIWMTLQYNDARTDVDGQISVAIAKAKDEQTSKMEAEFLEREKYPFKVFKGPADYGELTFEYPKTWSVYVESAANSGGDFNAYFNPIQIDELNKDTINALRVSIMNTSFDSITEKLKRDVDRKNSELTVEAVTIGKDNNITANRYSGRIPSTVFSGYIVTFKIRDKTVMLQTDSVLFTDDFNKLLGTIIINQ